MSITLIFLILPISTIVLLFIKDSKKTRSNILNFVLIVNTLIFCSPLIYAFLKTLPDGNMWSENGPGAVLWSYLILIPFCAIMQFIILILKIVFNNKKQTYANKI